MNIKCNICNIVQTKENFTKDKSRKNGYKTQCKNCRSNYYKENKGNILFKNKEYRKNNKETISTQKKEYYSDNKTDILETRKNYYQDNKTDISIRHKQYYQDNKIKLNKDNTIYVRNRYKNEPLFKLKQIIRKSINQSLRNNGYTKKSRTYDILGSSFEEFKIHLESQFEDWMSWDNHGKYNGEEGFGWDIDHIIPISEGKTENEILKLNHYSNLQPLCSKINRDIKRDNLDY